LNKGDKQRGQRTPRGKQASERTGRDARFSEYLSTSFDASGPARDEGRIRRNRTVLMAVLGLLALVWLLYRIFA
jgi:hypothetical protein